MQTEGVVHNGAVILEGGSPFPEGTRVIVSVAPPASPVKGKTRIKLPLVHCDKPASVHLTNERIWQIFDDEDLAPRH